MFNILKYILISSFLLGIKIYAQDSLFLVGTITGESTDKRITNVKGIGDINGDGYDDFMVSERTGKKVRDEGIVNLYLGAADGNLIPDITFHYPGKDSLNDFGQNLTGVGDINGDGYNDFMIGGIFADWGAVKGKSFLYLGGETIDTIPIAEFYEPWFGDSFGDTYGLGDINKDGFDDFIITSSYNWSDATGRVYLFWGGTTISWNECDTLSGNLFYPQSVANIGDINEDGYDDIAIGISDNPSHNDTGKVFIYYGGNHLNNIPDTIIVPNVDTYEFGRIVKNAGDINGDGINNFFINSGDYIFFFNGIKNHMHIDGSLLGFGGYLNLESNLDINNDGYNDYIIGNTNFKNSDSIMIGGAFVYLGSENIDSVYKYKFEGQNQWGEFSKLMAHADINGDGFDEILIMAPGFPDYEIPMGKVYIYSYKKFTDIKDHKDILPNNFKLYQNYPNPFNPTTTINYSIALRCFVTMKIYDALGKEIATLVNEEKQAGAYKVNFDGNKYASGVYFYQLKINDVALTKKMILLQ